MENWKSKSKNYIYITNDESYISILYRSFQYLFNLEK